MQLKNKTILLTGASGGIGFALSGLLAREGVKLVLVGRKFKKKELGKRHVYIETDLTQMYGIKN